MELPRRELLKLLGAASLGLGCDRGSKLAPAASEVGSTPFAGKAADLVLLTDRPPNLEMPLHYLRHDLTPNEAFFVRWHLAGVPSVIDRRAHKLTLGGHVERPLQLSLDELEKLDAVEIVAVNQCAGNGRGLSAPRVPGLQWTHGAMGNARFRGVRLRDLLAKAGVKAGAVDVTFHGADRAPLPATPAFVKALGIERALHPDVIVAYQMNGAPLPMLNGFPLRLVVPGWYSTYWVKALEEITVTSAAFDGFWMAKAYRIPKNEAANESPDALATDTVPISSMVVRSFLVPPSDVRVGSKVALEGVAFDGGSGIQKVELSTDGGATWSEARLDAELGKYAWRRFRFDWTPNAAGSSTLMSRATSASGETQTSAPRWNRAGYMRNLPEPLLVSVS